MTPSRRLLLGAGFAALALPACTPAPEKGAGSAKAATAAADGFFAKNKLPIGIQIYTLDAQAEADLPGALKTIKDAGYETIELAGLRTRTGVQWREALDRAGLRATAAHIPPKSDKGHPDLSGDLPRLAAELKTVGVEYAVAPGYIPSSPQRADETYQTHSARMSREMSADDWKRNADFLNKTGKALRAEGVKFGYHNHNAEFAPVGGTTGLAIMLDGTDPALVDFELDMGWAASSGTDAFAMFQRWPDRFRLMHVKDVAAGQKPNFAAEILPTEVGSGTVDWAKILPAAYAAGVRHFFVEQEEPFARPVADAIKISHGHLAGLKA